MLSPPHQSPCPLCGGAGGKTTFPYSTRWNGRLFSYVECCQCRCTFVSPLPGPADFDAMYSRDDYFGVLHDDTETDALSGSLRFLSSYAPRGRLLDFGAGAGAFLLGARKRGYDAQGVEQNATSIEIARRNSGAEVSTLEELEQAGERFDVIHLADVLEHLPQPGAILGRLEALLAPDGVFFLEGPLEKQRSIVYRFASSVKAARRRLGMDRDGDCPPYHLTLTDWKAQAHFFETVMGYALRDLALYETGWPYPASFGGSVGHNVRAAVGRAAVKLAGTGLGKRMGLANRFRVIARPTSRI